MRKVIFPVLLYLTANFKGAMGCDVPHWIMGYFEDYKFKTMFALTYNHSIFKQTVYVPQNPLIYTPYFGGRMMHLLPSVNGKDSIPVLYRELYRTTSLIIRHNLNSHWQINLSLPFAQNSIHWNDSNVVTLGGLSDPSLTFLFITKSKQKENQTLQHDLRSGMGLYFPAGTYQLKYVSGFVPYFGTNGIAAKPIVEYDRQLQPGRGSWSMQGQFFYTLGFKNWGLQLNNLTLIHFPTKDHYRFGNYYFLQAGVMRNFNAGTTLFRTLLGISHETQKSDHLKKTEVLHTGRNVWFLHSSLFVLLKNNGLMIQAFFPVHQNYQGKQAPLSMRVNVTWQYFIRS